ncbi:lysoplasmalogenase [Chitinophaga japonensis]|uniref:Putative membrane protein YhhN n=1 Tax=Chitinophaga japonensis TaxID=104662 RepID=A0A562TF91_CHIJA|nr:lysoplasmalogenase [Chitinophaga japonensis]TWI91938.1 putative membrane protein YhhN [Chitinophaga japonensis]
MKKQPWLFLYFAVLAIHLTAIAAGADTTRYLTKPLLIPLLGAYLLTNIHALQPAVFRNLLLTALFFSWAGDVLLLWDRYFLAGLACFLLAHLAYIGFFLKVRYSNPPRPLCKIPLILLVEAVVLAFLFFIYPYLGGMTVPVVIYAIAISFILLCSLHAFRFREQPMAWFCVGGAILFIGSDAMIALQRFYQSFPTAGIWIMLTYGLAQWAITEGSGRYLISRTKV